MRLVNVDTLQLGEFSNESPPPYAILSHTWRDEEVTYQDMSTGNGLNKAGYLKIQHCCRQAKEDRVKYCWIDTCCIDKTSSAELSEALNSMFSWYERALCCYVLLDDYPVLPTHPYYPEYRHCTHSIAVLDNVSDTLCSKCFSQCRWFTRGWTLQELLAPTYLEFYSSSWALLGYIGQGRGNLSRRYYPQVKNLAEDIEKITDISVHNLHRHTALRSASIAQRFSWASKRQTSRAEDMAYCLLGLFNIHLPILYGEGLTKAFIRLQEEIMKVNDDQSIFAWCLYRKSQGLVWDHTEYLEVSTSTIETLRGTHTEVAPVLADSPSYFEHSGRIVPSRKARANIRSPHTMTSRGLRIDIHFMDNRVQAWSLSGHCQELDATVSYVALGCVDERDPYCALAIPVVKLEENVYARFLCLLDVPAVVDWPIYDDESLRATFLLQQPQFYQGPVLNTNSMGVASLLRKWPEDFGKKLECYPPERWNRLKGIIWIPSEPRTVELQFDLNGQHGNMQLVFTLSHDRQKLVYQVGTRQNRQPRSIAQNILIHRKDLIAGGDSDTLRLENKKYRICLKEDAVLGGVFALVITKIPDANT